MKAWPFQKPSLLLPLKSHLLVSLPPSRRVSSLPYLLLLDFSPASPQQALLPFVFSNSTFTGHPFFSVLTVGVPQLSPVLLSIISSSPSAVCLLPHRHFSHPLHAVCLTVLSVFVAACGRRRHCHQQQHSGEGEATSRLVTSDPSI